MVTNVYQSLIELISDAVAYNSYELPTAYQSLIELISDARVPRPKVLDILVSISYRVNF